jgi:aminopeptidase N
VTCEDFVACMEEASGRDFGQFMRWYRQAGTPEVTVRRRHDPATGRYALDVSQRTPPTPGQPDKEPFHLPLRLGLLGRDGRELPLQLEGENEPKGTDRVLELTEAAQTFTFLGVGEEEPVPSLLRNFSAPVKLDAGYTDDELALLLAQDSDAFVRWDAGQGLALRSLLRQIEAGKGGGAGEVTPDPRLADAFAAVLDRAGEDRAFAARALQLPSASYLGQQMAVIDVDGIASALRSTRAGLGRSLRDRWLQAYRDNVDAGEFSVDTAAMARRSLKNTALAYLAWAGDEEGRVLASRQLASADNMTDSLSALRLVVETGMPEADEALASFYDRWRVRAPGRQQVVLAPGDAGGRRVRRARRAPDDPPRLHPDQPEPRPLRAGRLRPPEPAGLPPPRRRRLPACRREGRRARPAEPLRRRAVADGVRQVEAVRRGAARADAGGTGAGGWNTGAVSGQLRDRQQEFGVRARS